MLAHVRRLVERRGGELVLGWSVCDVPLRPEIRPQQNRFARTALNAHAVWLYQGRYHETCPERVRMKTRFLATGEASVMCDAGIEYFDCVVDAEAANWRGMSTSFRPMSGLLVDLRSSTVGPETGASAPAPRVALPYPYTILANRLLEGRVVHATVAARVLEFARMLDPGRDHFIDEEVIRDPFAFPANWRECLVRRADADGLPIEIMAARRSSGGILFVVCDPAGPVSPVKRVYLL